MDTQADHPYAALTPDCVLNALENVGLYSDGRLLALNSYENRVYQVGMETGAPLVAKFYRPARWTDAAILAGAGIPTVVFGPGGAGLHSTEEFVYVDQVLACRDVLADLAGAFCAG